MEVADNDKSHSVPSCLRRRPVNSDSVEVTVSHACIHIKDQQLFELCVCIWVVFGMGAFWGGYTQRTCEQNMSMQLWISNLSFSGQF